METFINFFVSYRVWNCSVSLGSVSGLGIWFQQELVTKPITYFWKGMCPVTFSNSKASLQTGGYLHLPLLAGFFPFLYGGKKASVRGSIMSDSLWLHWPEPTSPFCPWDFPGKNTGVGSYSLLQGIFPTHALNPGILLCRQILYCLIHQGSLGKKWEGE